MLFKPTCYLKIIHCYIKYIENLKNAGIYFSAIGATLTGQLSGQLTGYRRSLLCFITRAMSAGS